VLGAADGNVKEFSALIGVCFSLQKHARVLLADAVHKIQDDDTPLVALKSVCGAGPHVLTELVSVYNFTQ
jgi:hypothetical protein